MIIICGCPSRHFLNHFTKLFVHNWLRSHRYSTQNIFILIEAELCNYLDVYFIQWHSRVSNENNDLSSNNVQETFICDNHFLQNSYSNKQLTIECVCVFEYANNKSNFINRNKCQPNALFCATT